jgi:O-antigen ligase
VDAVLRWIAYTLIGLSAAVAVRSLRHLRQLAAFVIASAVFQGIYGSAEYLSGHQHIFWYPKEYGLDEASGTFINRNHFAAYLAIALPVASAALLTSRWRGDARSLRAMLLGLTRREGFLIFASGLAIAMIWVGVLFSYSRGGLTAALAGVAFLFLASRRHRLRGRLLAMVLLVPTVLLLWLEVRAPGERFLEQGLEQGALGNRQVVWTATLRMAREALPAGTGLGTFGEAFPLYRPASVRLYWAHAHNDWLESLSEGGPVTTLAVLGLAWLAVSAPFRRRQDESQDSNLWIAGVAGAVLAVGVHSLVDFPLRIPAVAALTSTLVGIVCGNWASGDPERGSPLEGLPRLI